MPGELRFTPEEAASLTADKLTEKVLERAFDVYEKKEASLGLMPGGAPPHARGGARGHASRRDEYWMDHLDAMTELRRGIALRGYGNTKPIDAYKNEGFEMFEAMIRGIREETVRRLYIVRIAKQQPIERKSVSSAQDRQRRRRAPEEKAHKKDKEARPQRPLPLRQASSERPADEVQGLLRPQRLTPDLSFSPLASRGSVAVS